MADTTHPEIESQSSMVSFTILGSPASIMAPRVGNLSITGRKALSTPHYIPLTTRGSVSHIAHDVMRDQTSISSLYLGLEDCMCAIYSRRKRKLLILMPLGPRSVIEKQSKKGPPAIYKTPTAASSRESALRKFICMPEDMLLVLGPRREPPIACPPSNTPNAIAILTSVGFRHLDIEEYIDAVQKLKPDIVVGLADLVVGQPPGMKRKMKMVDRTHAYTMDATETLYGEAVPEEKRCETAYFAPVLPLENTQQLIYLEELEDDMRPLISGLALYEAASLSIIPEGLGDLPRLLFSAPRTPHDILREVALGADLVTIPFLGTTSDAGMALHFTYPIPSSHTPPPETLDLALDLWSSTYTTDTRPLVEDCPCYTCQTHHRAYIHHLLTAREMLAWTLLQIHNHTTIDLFFANTRASIRQGTFEQDTQAFERTYASQLPEKTGDGPRCVFLCTLLCLIHLCFTWLTGI